MGTSAIRIAVVRAATYQRCPSASSALGLHPPPDLMVVEEAGPDRRTVPQRAREPSPGGEDRGALGGLVSVMKHEARHEISLGQAPAPDIGCTPEPDPEARDLRWRQTAGKASASRHELVG